MQWLASICVRRPVFATVLILTIAVVGVVGYSKLNVDRFPNVDLPDRRRSSRRCRAPSPAGGRDRGHGQDRGGDQHHQRHRRAALDLDRGRLAGHRQLPARQGHQRRRAGGARARVAWCCPICPRGRRARSISKLDPDAAPVLFVALESTRPIREVTEFADHEVRQALENVAGVGQVTIVGGRKRQIQVDARSGAAAGGRADAPSTSSAPSSAQNITHAGRRGRHRPAAPHVPRQRARRRASQAIGDIVVRSVEGHPILVRDVGTRRRRRGRGRDRRQHRRQAGGRAVDPQAVGREQRRGRRRAHASASRSSRRRCPPATS